MLNVGSLNEGFVLDHIKAGKSMSIYKYLRLDKLDCQIAIIKNTKSNKMGKKDIIKVETPLEHVNIEILGFIDREITVNIIKDGKIIRKETIDAPNTLTNILHCKNPRCITSIEQELDDVFVLTDKENAIYRCKYCEEKLGKIAD